MSWDRLRREGGWVIQPYRFQSGLVPSRKDPQIAADPPRNRKVKAELESLPAAQWTERG